MEIRARAFDLLRAYRDGGHRLPAAPREDLVHELVNFIIGQEVSPDYAAFLNAERAMNGEDPYAAPGLGETSAEARAGFRVLITGAGMSGLLAGIRLKEAGIPFLILERPANVGGSWYLNTYPGCRVDSPNHNYSYSFRRNDWPQYYSQQEVLRQCFDQAATDYGLREHIRLGTPVRSASSGPTSRPGALPESLVPLRPVTARARSVRQADRGDRHRRGRLPVRA